MEMTKNKQKILRGKITRSIKRIRNFIADGNQTKRRLKKREHWKVCSVAQPQPPIVEQQESLVTPIAQENLEQSIIQEQDVPFSYARNPPLRGRDASNSETKALIHPLEVGTIRSQTDQPISARSAPQNLSEQPIARCRKHELLVSTMCHAI